MYGEEKYLSVEWQPLVWLPLFFYGLAEMCLCHLVYICKNKTYGRF